MLIFTFLGLVIEVFLPIHNICLVEMYFIIPLSFPLVLGAGYAGTSFFETIPKAFLKIFKLILG